MKNAFMKRVLIAAMAVLCLAVMGTPAAGQEQTAGTEGKKAVPIFPEKGKGRKLPQVGRLSIGWAKRDVSTRLPVLIPGGFSMRISKGVSDPVTVTALALDNGHDAVIFLSCDLLQLSAGQIALLKREIAKTDPSFPLAKLLVHSTHSHTTPAIAGPGRHGVPEGIQIDDRGEYRDFFYRSAAEAVTEAWKKRSPGSVAWGYGFVVAGFSRRTIYSKDLSQMPYFRKNWKSPVMLGHGTMHGPNIPEFSHYEAGMDPFANFLFTFDDKGKLTGAVINLSATAQCGNPDFSKLSADFWNEVRENLCARYGRIHILPQCAAAGDITPRQQHFRKAQARRLRLKYGDRSGEYAIRYRYDIADRIGTAFDEVLSWAGKEKYSFLPLRHTILRPRLKRAVYSEEAVARARENLAVLEEAAPPDKGDLAKFQKESSLRATMRAKYKNVLANRESAGKNPTEEAELHFVRLGDIAFASNPFELYIDYMHRIQRRSPFELTFIIQLAHMGGGARGYLPTARAVSGMGYSAEPYSYRIGPEGGETLVNVTVKELHRLWNGQ
ncbi:MAG: hypothetical protein J6A21_13210 [Lentisphaeria bacterium]|nr:hypothetical protein [Lentisphaeria bacterium]